MDGFNIYIAAAQKHRDIIETSVCASLLKRNSGWRRVFKVSKTVPEIQENP